MVQDALDRWWWPTLMLFGPPDHQSPRTQQSMVWRIKRFSNDELRQRFVDLAVPQVEHLGLTLPDPELRWEAAANHYRFRSPDWEELRTVLVTGGPCGRERMSRRRGAHEAGRWVREAALTHAAKHERTEAPA